MGKQASVACRHRSQFVGTGRREKEGKEEKKKGEKEKKGKKRPTDGRKISPFYRTSSPIGAAAQKRLQVDFFHFIFTFENSK